MRKFKIVGKSQIKLSPGQMAEPGDIIDEKDLRRDQIEGELGRENIEEVLPTRKATVKKKKAPKEWKLKMTPAEYVKRHPEGKHATLAIKLMQASGEIETPDVPKK